MTWKDLTPILKFITVEAGVKTVPIQVWIACFLHPKIRMFKKSKTKTVSVLVKWNNKQVLWKPLQHKSIK